MRNLFGAFLLLFMLTGRAQADAFEDAVAGVKALKEGNLGNAEGLLSQAIDSGQLDGHSLVEALALRCAVYVNDRAMSDCSRAIQLDASYSPAHLNIALAYMSLGKLEEAISEINQALRSGQLSPKQTATAYSNRGSILIMLGQYDFAIDDLTKALEIDPANLDAYINRANGYIGIQDFEKALADAEAALRINPGSLNALNARGNVWLFRKDNTRAMADFDRAIELEPDKALTYYNRAVIKLTKSDGNGAIADLDRALELNPDAAYAYYLRGLAYRKVKQEDLAKRDIARATKIDPKAPQEVDELLRKLQIQ